MCFAQFPSQFSERPLSTEAAASLPTLPLPHRRCQGAAEKTKPWAFSQLLCPSETTWWGDQLMDGVLVLTAISAWAVMSKKSVSISGKSSGSFPACCFVETKVLEVQSATSEVEFLPKLWRSSRVAKGRFREMAGEAEIISSWYDGVSYRVYQNQPKGANPKDLWRQWVWFVWNVTQV